MKLIDRLSRQLLPDGLVAAVISQRKYSSCCGTSPSVGWIEASAGGNPKII